MKAFFLIIILGAFLNANGQNGMYECDTEKKAVRLAYDILKAYYPAGDLCVSDSVYDLDWMWFANKVDAKTKPYLENHRIDKKFVWDAPVYSVALDSVFASDLCAYDKYVAEFSAPYHGMIRCNILPKDRKLGIFGAPVIPIFLFRFNDEGDIYVVVKSELNID